MISNSKRKSFAAMTARLLVLLVAVCMVLAVAPRLTEGILPKASAADSIESNDVNTINNFIANHGEEINILLTGDMNVSGGGIEVPSGHTVNFYMNGKTITTGNYDHYQSGSHFAFTNAQGSTLNIYSGSPGSPALPSGNSLIYMENTRTDMSRTDGTNEQAFTDLNAVKNEGTVTVNKGVKIEIHVQLEYGTGGDNDQNTNVNLGATGVWNANNSAKCVINAAEINCYTRGRCANANSIWHSNHSGSNRSLSYGVYGGIVTVNGDAKFNVTAESSGIEGKSGSDEGSAKTTAVAFGVCSSQKITVNGGTFNYSAHVDGANDGMKNATSRFYVGGICYSSVAPDLADGTINKLTTNIKTTNEDMGNISLSVYEAPVGKMPTLPVSGHAVATDQTYRNENYDYNITGATVGQYFDESGNVYDVAYSNSNDSHPSSIIHGAAEGKIRVHIVYRFWQDAIKTQIYTTEGNPGYSYKPTGDGTSIVNQVVKLNGLTAADKFTKTKNAGVSYNSGADSKNNYYWTLNNLAFANPDTWFSDYDVTDISHRGTVFKAFVNGNQNGSAGAGQDLPLYIFVDYYKAPPTGIRALVGTANSATTTYTGSPIRASDIGLKIQKSTGDLEDFTADYNIDFASNSTKIPVTFTWTGTNAAGRHVEGDGRLPTDAGEYNVTLVIADSREYDPNDCAPATHKNRLPLSYEFFLKIDQAPVTRGTLVESKTLTYGTKLNEALTFNSYVAKGVLNENVSGVFSFTNEQDGNAYKPVGSGEVSITWTPTYTIDAQTKNYCETSFTVAYTVERASLVIAPTAASVVYGTPASAIPYNIEVVGLVGNDNTASNIAEIAASLVYEINVNNGYVAYDPDEINCGSYDIRARVNQASIPAVLSNYTYSYADLTSGYTVNQLTVTKRPLIVKATAVSRPFAPEDHNVTVTFSIVEGLYGADDVRFTAGSGTVSNNNAGTQQVGGVTKNIATGCMTGAKAANYQIAELVYETGTYLTVEISKAVPEVSTPTVDEFYYQRTKTLGDVPMTFAPSAVEGNWYWADTSINPTVAVSTYSAKFVPSNENYNVKYVDVTVNVRPTPVKITFNGSVEYGDPSPNLTDYTFISEQDPGFDINSVQTTGNIRFSSTYTQGSPVNAEGYPVQFTLGNFADSAGNYIFSVEDGRILVTPRNIEFTVSDLTIEYGDNFVANADSVAVSYDAGRLVGTDTISAITKTGVEPTWNYTTTYRYSDNYAVGNYELSIDKTFDCSDNYTVSVKKGTLTVAKAPLTIRANSVTLPYNSEVPSDLATSYTFIGVKKNESLNQIVTAGAITVDTNYAKGSPVSTEGYPIVVNINGATIPNYNVTVENGTITVRKATPVIRSYPTASIVYGQTLADAVFTGGAIDDDVPGAYVYNAPTTKPAYSSEPYTNYTASFIPADTDNYNTVTGLTISLTVSKTPISGSLAVKGLPMVGKTLEVDVSGLTPDEKGVYSFAWVIDGTTVSTDDSYTIQSADELKALTVTATAQGFYVGSRSYTVAKIAPVLTDVNEIINADRYADFFDLTALSTIGGTSEVTYDATEHAVTLLQKDATQNSTVVGDITVKYNGSAQIPVNAGLYTVTVDVATPALDRVGVTGVTVYSPATGIQIGTLQIKKAEYNVTVTVADKVYDGFNTAVAQSIDESGAVTLPGGVKDDVAFDAARAIYTFADANVGTDKTVVAGNEALTGTAAANYELNFSLANNAKANITKRTLNVTVDPVERPYEEDRYDVDLSFVVDVTSIAPADTAASVYVNEEQASGRVDDYHAGRRSVTVSGAVLDGAKKANYELNLTNLNGLTVEIEKAAPFYPLPRTGDVTYSSGRTLSNISLGDSRWAWAESVANLVPGAGAHTYTAVFTPDDPENYATVDYEVSMTVKKAPVVIKAASFTTVYGDYAPTYYYTATGLTGADTIKSAAGGYVLLDCAYEPGMDVGNYDIVIEGEFSSPNYSFTYQNGTLSIAPRPAYVTASAQSRQYEEGNTNVNVTFSALSNIYASDASNVYIGGTQPVIGTIADANAGTKVVSYNLPALAGSKAGNYTLTLLNPELTVEIAKAVLEGVTLPTSGTVKYGAKLQTTEFTSSYIGEDKGTFSMENPMSTPAAVGTTSDVYKVVFTPNNTINYATISDYITLTVTTADLNVELSLAGSAEVGKKLYVATNDLPADAYQYIEYRWYRVDSRTSDVRDGQLVASGVAEYTVTEKDADHFIVCVATQKSNSPYNIDAKTYTESTVSKQSMSLWERLLKWFYRVIASITQLFGKIGG